MDIDGGVATDQIVHSCQTLINLSDFPVIVFDRFRVRIDRRERKRQHRAEGVRIAPGFLRIDGHRAEHAEVSGFVSAPPAQDAPGKDVFLYAEFQQDPSAWVGEYWGLPYHSRP